MKIDTDPLDTMFEFARCLGTNTEPSSIVGLTIPSLREATVQVARVEGAIASIQNAMVLPDPPPVEIEQSNAAFKAAARKALNKKLAEFKEVELGATETISRKRTAAPSGKRAKD